MGWQVLYMFDRNFISHVASSVLNLLDPTATDTPTVTAARQLVVPRLRDMQAVAPFYISDLICSNEQRPPDGLADFGVLFLHGMVDADVCHSQNHTALGRISELSLDSHSCVFGSVNLVHLIGADQSAIRQSSQYGDLAYQELRQMILSAWPLTMGFFTDGELRESIFKSIQRAVDLLGARLRTKQFMIVGLDLGGTIAARFLGQRELDVCPSHLVTLGCPFSWFEDMMTCPLPASCEWHNVFFKRDICSTPLETVLSARVTERFVVIDHEIEDDKYSWRPWQAWFSALNNLYLQEDKVWEVVGAAMHNCCRVTNKLPLRSTL